MKTYNICLYGEIRKKKISELHQILQIQIFSAILNIHFIPKFLFVKQKSHIYVMLNLQTKNKVLFSAEKY